VDEQRKGRQTPTRAIVLPYDRTHGQEAIDLYNSTGRAAQQWQELQLYDILSVRSDGLWVHTKYGYSVPRRNGKNEIVAIRELYGLTHGERILHTAHRTTTSASAARRLAALLDAAGYTEVIRQKKGQAYALYLLQAARSGADRPPGGRRRKLRLPHPVGQGRSGRGL